MYIHQAPVRLLGHVIVDGTPNVSDTSSLSPAPYVFYPRPQHFYPSSSRRALITTQPSYFPFAMSPPTSTLETSRISARQLDLLVLLQAMFPTELCLSSSTVTLMEAPDTTPPSPTSTLAGSISIDIEEDGAWIIELKFEMPIEFELRSNQSPDEQATVELCSPTLSLQHPPWLTIAAYKELADSVLSSTSYSPTSSVPESSFEPCFDPTESILNAIERVRERASSYIPGRHSSRHYNDSDEPNNGHRDHDAIDSSQAHQDDEDDYNNLGLGNLSMGGKDDLIICLSKMHRESRFPCFTIKRHRAILRSDIRILCSGCA